jgi:hypothetical protein
MAGTTGTFGWLRSVGGASTLPGMALASAQGSAEVSANPADAYLLEVYRQVADNPLRTATPPYARLAAFLAFVGVVTAALAVMVALPESPSGSLVQVLSMAIGAIGIAVSIASYALEVRASRASGGGTDSDAAAYTTSSIYLASTGFFAFTVVISAALLLVR